MKLTNKAAIQFTSVALSAVEYFRCEIDDCECESEFSNVGLHLRLSPSNITKLGGHAGMSTKLRELVDIIYGRIDITYMTAAHIDLLAACMKREVIYIKENKKDPLKSE